MNVETLDHRVSFTFHGYRCSWSCSCGSGSAKITKDTYLGARRKSVEHLIKVGGEVDQPYVCTNNLVVDKTT